MMKQILLFFALVLALPGNGQTTKEARIKEIRSAYAKAKQKIEQNKKSSARKDLAIHSTVLDDPEIPIYTVSTYNYYFDEDSEGNKHPYFVSTYSECHGHVGSKEILIDPETNKVMFCFAYGETDGGFKVESRYYYDKAGNLIEQKHNTPNTWTTGEGEMGVANDYLQLFKIVEALGLNATEVAERHQPTMPKAERMKHIRSVYAEAKQKIERNKQAEFPQQIQITRHDLGETAPPRTTDLQLFFEANGCYFASMRSQGMGYEGYDEYLFEPGTKDLIFAFVSGKEEGQALEWRYYYDENGKCIETKTNTDMPYSDNSQQKARDLQLLFKKLVLEGE